MVLSNKFVRWRDSTSLPVGSKIRGLVIYKNFVNSSGFRKIPKKVFYDWMRFGIDDITEGKDARGIWFMIDKPNMDGERISHFAFLSETCLQFVDWFSSVKDEISYTKISSSDLRDKFLGEICDGRDSVDVGDKSIYLSKQKFNKWVGLGANRFGMQILTGRDASGKWTMLM